LTLVKMAVVGPPSGRRYVRYDSHLNHSRSRHHAAAAPPGGLCSCGAAAAAACSHLMCGSCCSGAECSRHRKNLKNTMHI
jgi:hypothetical protein